MRGGACAVREGATGWGRTHAGPGERLSCGPARSGARCGPCVSTCSQGLWGFGQRRESKGRCGPMAGLRRGQGPRTDKIVSRQGPLMPPSLRSVPPECCLQNRRGALAQCFPHPRSVWEVSLPDSCIRSTRSPADAFIQPASAGGRAFGLNHTWALRGRS